MTEETVANGQIHSVKMNRLYLSRETQERKREIDRICYLVSHPTNSFHYFRFLDGNHYSVAGEEEVKNFCRQMKELSDEEVREILIAEKERVNGFWNLLSQFQIERKIAGEE